MSVIIEEGGQRYFERFTLSQRVQHMALMVSFSALMVTGLPLRLANYELSGRVVHAMGGEVIRSLLHRASALALIGVCIYHMGFIMFNRRGHDDFLGLMPNWRDVQEFWQNLRYLFWLSPDRPEFGRFGFVEKFEYLAMAWGSAVMILSGLVLWFEVEAMVVFPKVVLDIARVIHSWEAWLALLAIVIWHFYMVHFNPGDFPLSWVWWHGKLTEHQMKEHHPREYRELVGEASATGDRQPEWTGFGIRDAGRGGDG